MPTSHYYKPEMIADAIEWLSLGFEHKPSLLS
jgi:hypothetical protein